MKQNAIILLGYSIVVFSATAELTLLENNVTNASRTSSTSLCARSATVTLVVSLPPLPDVIKWLRENSAPAKKMSKEELATSANLLSGISSTITQVVALIVPVT